MRITALVLLIPFVGCLPPYRAPVATVAASNNKAYIVEYLFEHDGCKVYRFTDLGHVVYFTNCSGEAISYPDSSAIIKNKTTIKN